MSDSERQQRMVERILEDERLRGDLEDEAASALMKWASEQAATAAADPARSDEVVEAQVQAVRAAAREVSRSGESDPQRLIAQAQVALTQRQAALAPATPEAPLAAAAPAATSAPAPAAPGTAAEPPPTSAPQSSSTAAPSTATQHPPTDAPQSSSSAVRATAPQSRSDRPRRASRLSRWLKRLRAGR